MVLAWIMYPKDIISVVFGKPVAVLSIGNQSLNNDKLPSRIFLKHLNGLHSHFGVT